MDSEVWSGIDVQIWRANMGWTQGEAAVALGVNVATYVRIERRKIIDQRTKLACEYLERGFATGT